MYCDVLVFDVKMVELQIAKSLNDTFTRICTDRDQTNR